MRSIKMKKEELLDSMVALSREITTKKTQVLNLKREIKDLDESLKKIKVNIERDVADELDNGKPKYSNADKRMVEAQARLDSHPTYSTINTDRENKQKMVEDIEIQISSNSYMFRAYESFANFKE